MHIVPPQKVFLVSLWLSFKSMAYLLSRLNNTPINLTNTLISLRTTLLSLS